MNTDNSMKSAQPPIPFKQPERKSRSPSDVLNSETGKAAKFARPGSEEQVYKS